MRVIGLDVRAQLARYGKNTSEGVAANLITQVLIYTAGAAPAVLPAFFNPENIFSVLLVAAVLTGVQFTLQYPAIGDIRPEDSLREEISRLRELIQLLVSARVVVRTDGGTRSLPRLSLPRYSGIFLGSALTIPLATLSANIVDTLFLIVVVGAISSNLGDAIGMAAYQKAMERYDREDASASTDFSPNDLEFEVDDEEVTSNQERILNRLGDIRDQLENLFDESREGPFVVAPGRMESTEAFAEKVSSYVSDTTYEQFQGTRDEILSEVDEMMNETSRLRSNFHEFADEFESRLSEIEETKATERQVEQLLDEVGDMNERVASIETSLSSQGLDLDEFDQQEVRNAFREGRWSIVPGIGDNKEKTLREELPSIEYLEQTSLGELEQIDGVGPVLAYRLKRLEEFANEG
ncbi:helix-hairpin-helix domain-containing protein [Halopiger aswanensis]|uniref:Uncharacterized protein n=1 Tax=Halopiger aswanensis TaxID=148449 RepID=A0A3R7GSU5_9EURY|nr:hypothetical protein [Halopiger aswanensis]RKD87669.1 hypothetical protein ATJ93_4569 [Halopiger aswanensis]